MVERDYDKELSELKECINNIVTEERISEITKIVDTSYKLDKAPKYEVHCQII